MRHERFLGRFEHKTESVEHKNYGVDSGSACVAMRKRRRPHTGTEADGFTAPHWDSAASQWTQHIGYHLNTEGQRTRTRFRFGPDEPEAAARSLLKQRQWEQLKVLWPAHYRKFQEFVPEHDWTKPVWLDHPQTSLLLKQRAAVCDEAEGRTKALLTEAAEQRLNVLRTVVGDDRHLIDQLLATWGERRVRANETTPLENLSIAEAKDRFLEARRKRVGIAGRKGIQPNTFNGIRTTLHCALGIPLGQQPKVIRRPLDLTKRLSSLSFEDIEDYVTFWMALPDGIGSRTAINYCLQFKSFLRWCHKRRDFGFTMTEEMDEELSFQTPPSKIAAYDADTLRAVLDACRRYSEKTLLYVLLGLNCGYYQQDISDLLVTHLITHKGDPCLWRHRSKSEHQHAEGEMRVLHCLWPETLELLERHRAPQASPHGRLLLNEDGQPLVREPLGEVKKDAISPAYRRACEHLDEMLSFRQFRKIGWNAIKKVGKDSDIARMYAGQAIQGVAKCYNLDDYDVLTVGLKQWREELRADGVL